MISALRKGDKLVQPKHPDNYLEVLDPVLREGMVEVFDSVKKASRYIDDADVRLGISQGRWVLNRKGLPAVGLATQVNDAALLASIRLLQDALRHIEKIQAQLGLSFGAAIALAKDEHQREQADQPEPLPFPARATLYRAHSKKQQGLPLLRGNKNKGNTRSRYSQKLINLCQSLIEQYYLVPQSTWTIKDLTDTINRQACALELCSAGDHISSKFIKKMIAELTADAEYERMDPKLRVAGKSFAKKRMVAPYAFSRIEQDAVHLPFHIQTPHGVCSNVYLVHAIDVSTGYPMGWEFAIGPPKESDSLRCIEMYLTPKKAARFKALGIQHALNIYGTPSQIIFDNGPETKGVRIHQLESLGVDIKHCKAKEAQGKPFIERLNRSLKEALQRLPGSTRVDGKDGQRDPRALGEKLLSLEEIERWVVRWLYEDWVNSPLDRLCWDTLLQSDVKGLTPLERIAHVTQELGHPIPLPPSQREWIQVRYQRDICKLSAKTGITVDTLHYKGDDISYLLGKYGDGASLQVAYDPDDFRVIYVYESDDLPMVRLVEEHVQADTPAWSFAQAKENYRSSQKGYVIPQAKVQFHSDLDQQAMAKKRNPRSKRQENEETARNAKAFSAAVRAAQQPVQPITPYIPATQALPADVLSYDDVPDMPIVHRNTGEKLL